MDLNWPYLDINIENVKKKSFQVKLVHQVFSPSKVFHGTIGLSMKWKVYEKNLVLTV